MARIEDLPLATPVYNDIDLFADISDSNNAKSNTIGSKVKAGLSDPTVTADDLQDGATKKVLTAAERTKLAGIQAGAQVNTVTSVNGQMGVVVLDADDIADTAARKMGNEIFNTSEKNKLDTAYTHSQAVTGNPHNVTASQVGLGNVANERQLSRTAGNFNALPLKTDIQRNLNDLMVIQDDFDSDIIKKVTVGTQYIRYSSTIQLWRTSVNYHADTLVNSTTYEIRNIVIDEVTGGMYYCTVSHQSGANFASDLALGYWTPVLAGGGGSSPVYVIRGASNPTQAIPGGPRTPSGAFAGQLFANTVTADILVRDGNDWILNSAGGGGSGVNITVGVGVPVGSGTNPGDMYIDYNTANIYVWNGTSWVVNNATGGSGSGIIYSLANGTVVASTTGDRGLASTLTGADKAYETSQTIDPLTGHTINQTFGGLITWLSTSIQNFIAGAILQGSVIFNNLTVNNTGSTNYNNGIYNNPTINNPTITGTSSQSDWQQSNNTLPDFIKNKVVRPDQLGGTTTNGKGVVRDTNGTFRDLTASDITALGIGGSVIEKTETFIAGESISSGDHVSLGYYREQQLDSSDIIKTYNTTGASTTVNYGQAFDRPVSSPIVSITPSIRLSTLNESGGSAQTFNYSLQLKVYNITGTLGSTAVDTGSALLTSTNTATGTLSFTNIVQDIQFLFDGVTVLSSGQYAIKLEGTMSGTPFVANGVLRVRGDNTGVYVGNAIDNTTAIPGEDLSFIIQTPNQFALISDADDINRTKYIGQATESKTIGQNVLVKTRGVLSQTGATGSGEMRYLSNTAGDISTTPGTNKVYVGRGYSTDNISIRGLADFSLDNVSYSNLSFSGSSQEEVFYLSGGGLLNFSSSTNLGSSSIVSLSYQISKDGIGWTTLGTISSTSGGNETSQNSISIPANHYFRWSFGQDLSGGTATVTNINLIPF